MDDAGRILFADAAARAVELMAGDFAADRRPEERLRQSFLAALHEHGDVDATQPGLGQTAELRPQFPDWPNVAGSALGGFDLAVRMRGDELWRFYGEFKWDGLWMELWDAFKLAHAARLPGAAGVFLIAIAIATEREWRSAAAGAELFDDHTISCRDLIERHAKHWKKLLETSAKSRPRKLPQALTCTRVADIELETIFGPSRLRIASIEPTQADWFGLDQGWPLPVEESEIIEWPHPEPGPGMVARDGHGFRWPAIQPPPLTDDQVTPELVPGPDADWSQIEWFAASFNGYEEFGGLDNLAPLANLAATFYRRVGETPPLELRALRGCLFFEHRRHHHVGHAPSAETTPYIRALVQGIADAVAPAAERS